MPLLVYFWERSGKKACKSSNTINKNWLTINYVNPGL